MIIQVIDDPNRKIDDDKYNRCCRDKYCQIPKNFPFLPDVDEKNELYQRLDESQSKNGSDSAFDIQIKIFGVYDDVIGCKSQ
jgi:hypothetical protein